MTTIYETYETHNRRRQQPTITNVPRKRHELTGAPTTRCDCAGDCTLRTCPWPKKIDRRNGRTRHSTTNHYTIQFLGTCVQNSPRKRKHNCVNAHRTSQATDYLEITSLWILHLFRNESHKSCKYVTQRSLRLFCVCLQLLLQVCLLLRDSERVEKENDSVNEYIRVCITYDISTTRQHHQGYIRRAQRNAAFMLPPTIDCTHH